MSDSFFVEATSEEITTTNNETAADPKALATVEVKPENETLMKLEQVPIIIERLHEIKESIEQRTKTATELVCTEDNYKDIKKVRSAMNKEFAGFENQRKEIKKSVMTPYEEFEKVYKECVADPYKAAESELKKKIDAAEKSLKAEKEEKVRDHFEKYKQSLGIDFVQFEAVGCQITMSASVNKLKKQCNDFLDRVMEDIQLIATQEHKAEILVEYKRTLNVSLAIRTVKERFEAVAAENEREKADKSERDRADRNVAVNKAAFEPFESNVPQEIEAPEGETAKAAAMSETTVEEQRYSLSFTIHGTRDQLKAAAQYIKEYLNKEGLRYE